MRAPLFYKEKPIFGLDIGQSTVKATQLRGGKQGAELVGYGYAEFDPSAIEDGVITKPEKIAKVLRPLVNEIVVGKLTTDRVHTSIPTSRIFSRIIELSGIEDTDLEDAVKLEAQQYVPLNEDEMYLDFTILEHTDDDKTRVYMVAAPRNIIDSYIELFNEVGLEIYGTEPSLLSIVRAVNNAYQNEKAKIIIDFGSNSSDLAIYDQSLQLTSTVATGGNQITQTIAETLDVDKDKANEIKSRYGISKSKWQEELASALSPTLSSLASEIQKLLRYHHERHDDGADIEQVVIVGGGANLPGLDDFLAHLTGLDVDTCNPWDNIGVKPLQPPHKLETTLYTTAVGLALKELDQ